MSIRRSVAYAAVLCIALAGVVEAQARAGGGKSFGSRGSNSFSMTPSTRTAPNVSPLGSQPNYANQGLNRPATGARGGFFGGGFGRGLLGGFLGAGLLGLLFGHGLFGGLGGLMSILGLILQIGLVVLLASWAIRMFRSRQQSFAGAGPSGGMSGGASYRNASPGPAPGPAPSGFGSGAAPRGPVQAQTAPLAIEQADYEQFEKSLVGVQTAFSNEDAATLRQLATREMADEFASELAANRSNGVIDRMSDIHFVKGDLAEAWREPDGDYASVAMRYDLIDATIDRATGRVVNGDANRPQQVTEVWTFMRPNGGRTADWRLSAIQQAR